MATKRTPKAKKSQQKSSKTAPKPKSKAALKAKPKAKPKAAPKAKSAAKSKAASKAKPKAALKAKPKAAPKAKPKAAPKAKPKAASKAKPKAALKAKPKAASKAKPKAVLKAKPKAVPSAPKKARAAVEKAATPKVAKLKVAKTPPPNAAPSPTPSAKALSVGKAIPTARPSSAGAPPPRASQKGGLVAKPAVAAPHPDAITLAPRSAPGSLVIAGRSFVSAKATGSKAPVSRSAPPGGMTLVRRPTDRPSVPTPVVPLPVRKVETQPSTEQRFARIEARIQSAGVEFSNEYYALFDRSWIYHDSAIEGVVYTQEELEAGLGGEPIVTDSSLQPAADHIRRHKEAIEYVRDFGLRKKLPITVDVIKKIYLILHPSEGDLKTVKYRRDVPQHRLYFHEYAQPDKIAYKVRQIVDWQSEPETKRKGPLRIAARAHYDLLRVFPFQNDSGKVARLFMNMLLFRAGYPSAIIHATERQRYYDALKGEPNTILRIVQESVENGLASVERVLDEHDAKTRGG